MLEQVCPKIGYPKTIRVDQGSEFVSRGLDLWAYTRGVTLDFSRPGKPTDNAYIEAFNGRFRAECLNAPKHSIVESTRNQNREAIANLPLVNGFRSAPSGQSHDNVAFWFDRKFLIRQDEVSF